MGRDSTSSVFLNVIHGIGGQMAAEITSLPVEGKKQYFILEHTVLRHDAVRCLIFWYCHVV